MTEKSLTVFTEQYYNNVENDENYNNIYLTVATIISVYKTNLTNTNAHKRDTCEYICSVYNYNAVEISDAILKCIAEIAY